MTQQEKARQTARLIGLAQKAGKIASGEFAAEKAIKEEQASLVILAENASVNTEKKFSDMAAYRSLPLVYFLEKEALGHCIGKAERACLAVTDKALAEKIKKSLQPDENRSKQER